MQEHAAREAAARETAFRAYVQDVAGSADGAGAAGEITKLAELRRAGRDHRGRVPAGQGPGAGVT